MGCGMQTYHPWDRNFHVVRLAALPPYWLESHLCWLHRGRMKKIGWWRSDKMSKSLTS